MLWHCLECSTRYAFDLQACPNCGSPRREENDMAKITRLGGPSDARDVVEDQPPAETVEPTEEGEQPSAGTNSSASPLKTASTSKKSAAPRQRRARTTASRSSRDREENSFVPSTDGALSATPDEQDRCTHSYT